MGRGESLRRVACLAGSSAILARISLPREPRGYCDEPPERLRSFVNMATLPPYAELWMQQWHAAGPALEANRRRELSAFTDLDALTAANDLLAAAPPCSPRDPRWHNSGLVDLQRLLHRGR